jgi:hypothetical protein
MVKVPIATSTIVHKDHDYQADAAEGIQRHDSPARFRLQTRLKKKEKTFC